MKLNIIGIKLDKKINTNLKKLKFGLLKIVVCFKNLDFLEPFSSRDIDSFDTVQ